MHSCVAVAHELRACPSGLSETCTCCHRSEHPAVPSCPPARYPTPGPHGGLLPPLAATPLRSNAVSTFRRPSDNLGL